MAFREPRYLKKIKLIFYKKSTKWVQSGTCILKRLEMASRRRKIVIFRIDKKIWKKRIKFCITLTLVSSASGEARYFFQKRKLIYIEKSKRWAQSGFCSSSRLEMTSKRVDLLQKSYACKKRRQMRKGYHPCWWRNGL